MNKFISFSGGVESSTMAILFGSKADAIFADTGFEHKLIYKRIDLIEKYVQDNIRTDFKIHRISEGSLIDYIREYKFYPSFKARYCTRKFKIEPIDNFLASYDNVQLFIGLNADETDRTGNHGNKANIQYSYPLIDNNLSRQNCIDILKKVDLYPNFPAYMKRGGCIGCYYKSTKEYTAMALLNPEEFDIVEQLEEDIQDRRSEYFSIKQGVKMRIIRKVAQSTIFKPEEIYPTINDATNCGVFCNR